MWLPVVVCCGSLLGFVGSCGLCRVVMCCLLFAAMCGYVLFLVCCWLLRIYVVGAVNVAFCLLSVFVVLGFAGCYIAR